MQNDAQVPGLPLTPQQPETNGSDVVEAEARPFKRDERGRFLAGHGLGGRPLGSRNKLTEDFIEDFHDAWLESGQGALRHMVEKDPSAFVKAAVQLMPKDVLVEARGAVLAVVETPAAIKALLEALPDLGVLSGPVIDVEVDEVEVAPLKPDGEQQRKEGVSRASLFTLRQLVDHAGGLGNAHST